MNYTESVRRKISKLPPGEVFSVDTIKLSPSPTTRKILSRFEKQGKIQRLEGGAGLYYIPKEGVLGPVRPPRGKIINAILNGKKKGYRTGLPLYNALGLTTQVPGNIEIASEMYPKKCRIGKLDITFKKARAPITKKNIPLLQYLDVLLDIKTIPDTSPSEVIKTLKGKIRKLSKNDIKTIVKLANYYPSRVQALLGAILDDEDLSEYSKPLRQVLISGSVYKIGIKPNSLSTKDQWRIQ